MIADYELYQSGTFWVTMFLFFGMPILGWVASLTAMKFDPLGRDKMIEIQAGISDMKKESAK